MKNNVKVINIVNGALAPDKAEVLRRISIALYNELLKYAEIKSADGKKISA